MATETSFRSEESFTQESFRRWLASVPPSDIHHYELIQGRIVMSPPAGAWHACVGGRLLRLIGSHVDALGLGVLFDATVGVELLSDDTLEPDLTFVSHDRWQAGPRPRGNEFLRIVPTLVVETLSPSTARRDRTEKLEIYARNGVDEYWIVDVRRRVIEVYRREDARFGSPATVSTGRIPTTVLSGLAARVEDVFADLD